MLIVPDPDAVDPQALAERRRQKSRRRAALWGAFLLLGLALGTIYATGFAGPTENSTAGDSPSGAAVASPGANQDPSLSNNITKTPGALAWTWDGAWGSVANKVMYEVDLASEDIANTYYVGLYLDNTPAQFSDLVMRFSIADEMDDGIAGCLPADLLATEDGNHRTMGFESSDSGVTFNGLSTGAGISNAGLAGGEKYCVGIVGATGKGANGTMIRRVNSTKTFNPESAGNGRYPTFIATVNRGS